MKNAILCALLACVSVALAVLPTKADVLARVEAVERVDRLGLSVYANLLDARGQSYALVVASEAELKQAGWPFVVLARDPDVASLSFAIERMPGARERARSRIDILYDDGRRFIVTPTPGQKAALIEMGLAVIRIDTPMVWPSDLEFQASSLQARSAIVANPTISNMMNQVNQDTVSNRTAELSGETAAMIGGSPYTILTRGTSSGIPIQKASQFVYERLQAVGLEVSYQGWTNGSYSGQNIVGVKYGATRSNEVVVVTAHIDSIPNDGTRSPGADDNASGCVGAMIAASVFQGRSTDRTIRFICFGGEEQGLLGSDAYVQSIYDAGETNVTVFNMDMISYSTLASRNLSLHTRLATTPGYAADMAVATTFQDVLSTYGLGGRLTLEIVSDGESASDHYSFWQKGYPGVFAFECDTNMTPNYHHATDLMASNNMEYFTDYIRASVGTVAHLAGVSSTPPPPAPSAPTGVSAGEGTYSDKIAVTWNAVSNASGYQVWRAVANNSAAAVNIGNVLLPGYDDNSAAARSTTMYYYWVKAWNNVATSEFSAVDNGFCRMAESPTMVSGQPMAGDFDGDRKADPAVYNLANGRLFAWLSSANYLLVTPVVTFQMAVGDLPVANDFDGDRLADPGVFQRLTGAWYIWLSSAGYLRVGPVRFGVDINDMPIPADYDGDRLSDPAVCNAGANWYVWLSSAGYYRVGPLANFRVDAADVPVPAQFDADALADPAVYQATSGTWYVWLSSANYYRIGPVQLGTPGDHLAVPSDYDGDGLADPASYIPAAGVWRIWESGNGYALKELTLH